MFKILTSNLDSEFTLFKKTDLNFIKSTFKSSIDSAIKGNYSFDG